MDLHQGPRSAQPTWIWTAEIPCALWDLPQYPPEQLCKAESPQPGVTPSLLLEQTPRNHHPKESRYPGNSILFHARGNAPYSLHEAHPGEKLGCSWGISLTLPRLSLSPLPGAWDALSPLPGAVDLLSPLTGAVDPLSPLSGVMDPLSPLPGACPLSPLPGALSPVSPLTGAVHLLPGEADVEGVGGVPPAGQFDAELGRGDAAQLPGGLAEVGILGGTDLPCSTQRGK